MRGKIFVFILNIFFASFLVAQTNSTDHLFKLTGGDLKVFDFYISLGDTTYQRYEKKSMITENGDSILYVEFYNDRKNWFLYRYKIEQGKPNLYGWQQEFDLNGILQNERFCDFGDRECGVTKKYNYYPGGQISSIAGYKKNHLDGFTWYYYSNGQLRQQVEYKDGKLWNVFSSFDQDGNIMEKGDFKDGTGTLNVYSMNGKLIQTKIFDEGKLKKKIKIVKEPEPE